MKTRVWTGPTDRSHEFMSLFQRSRIADGSVYSATGHYVTCETSNNKRRKMAKDSPVTNVTSIINADLKLGQNGGFHTRGRNVKGVRELTVAYGPSFKV